MTTQRDKAERFRALHARGETFVTPNPWDFGSARLLEGLGFEALATTSSGLANALGRMDGTISLDELIEHCQMLSAATTLPFTADIENGYSDDLREAAQNIVRVANAGAAGGSIEDYTGDDAKPIYELTEAAERVQAAAEATHALDTPFTLTARAENLLHGRIDLDDTIKRLIAYADAGADVVYAPGLTTLDEIQAVVDAVDKPVNVLGPLVKNATVSDLAEIGVLRISIGGALARAASGAMLRAIRETQEHGTFRWTRDIASNRDLSQLLELASEPTKKYASRDGER